VLVSNFVSTGASSAADEATTRVAGPRFRSAAALKVMTLVAFKMSRLITGKANKWNKQQLGSLDFHKPREFLLLEVRPNSEVVMPRMQVCGESVVIYDLLGRHGGHSNGWVVMK
jgi:hypothetical protein